MPFQLEIHQKLFGGRATSRPAEGADIVAQTLARCKSKGP